MFIAWCTQSLLYKIVDLLAELGDYNNDEQVNTYIQEYQILPPVMTCILYYDEICYI